MSPHFDTISFLSDYGHSDEFVGVVHSVIRSIAPDVRVIDITHGLAPYDVRAAGLTLARSAQYLCGGVVMAIVDPGVGSTRRSVAVEVGDGNSILLGPDNGVLAPAVALVGGATAAVVLDIEEYHLPAPGPTFAGRDVFAPVAAHLCLGVPLETVGTPIDPSSLLPGTLPLSRFEGDTLVTEVLWVDRYGNAQLNLDPDDLDANSSIFELTTGVRTSTANLVVSFADLAPGGLGLLVDSYGLICLATDRSSAAESLGLGAGDEVTLRAVDAAQANEAPAGVEVPVALGRVNET